MDNKQQIIDLWRTCFDDSEEFIQLFFNRVYREEHAMVITQNGQIVSALQMLPYTMTFEGTEITAAYIYGACTAPEERGKGWMHQLLMKSFEEMKKQDIALSTLIPANPSLFEFYRELGYTESFYQGEEFYSLPSELPDNLSQLHLQPEVEGSKSAFTYLERKLRERPTCILHSYTDTITIQRSLRQEGGDIYSLRKSDGTIVALAFALPTHDLLLFKEILYETEEDKIALCLKLLQQTKKPQAKIQLPPSPSSRRPKGMARLIDPERLLTCWLQNRPNEQIKGMNYFLRLPPSDLLHLMLEEPTRAAYMSLMLD